MNTFETERKRLKWTLAAIFALIALAAGMLVSYAFGQLRYEAYFTQQQLAQDFTGGVVRELTRIMDLENARPATDYEFLVVSGETYVQRSPLSTLEPNTTVPGLIGYFQVDTEGRFSTPLLPPDVEQTRELGLTDSELEKRTEAEEQLRLILTQGDVADRPAQVADAAGRALASAAIEEAAPDTDEQLRERNRQIFDELSKAESLPMQASVSSKLGRVAEYELERFDEAPARDAVSPQALAQSAEPRKRKESARLVDQRVSPFELSAAQRITVFDSIINEFRMVPLDAEHLAFHREVFLDDARKIQGFVVAQAPFVSRLIGDPFAASRLAEDNHLLVALDDEVTSLFPALGGASYTLAPADLSGSELILEQRLPPPAQRMSMIVTADALALGAGFETLVLAAALMAAVIIGGFLLLYRLGRQSIALAEQQQDFVSAVSHELKTPLTSIRMYGEILKAGWADEDKKRAYYDFIFNESERLTRLVNNVLQLARISRGTEPEVSCAPIQVQTLIDAVRAQIDGLVTEAEFTLSWDLPAEALDLHVTADQDAFQQILLNLVDNAMKFSHAAERQEIEIGARIRADHVVFYVRDFGPGIAKDQMKRIFTLFYRGEGELTRETSGTGIGLSLVARLAEAMGGAVDVINRDPGAEFTVTLPRRPG